MLGNELLESKDIKLALTLKTNQLKREKLSSLTYRQVIETLVNYVWANREIKNIHVAINDIMNLEVSIVVAYLSFSAIEKGRELKLENIDDVLKGELDV